MKEKKEKSGFWASLFSSKPGSCSCNGAVIEEVEEKAQQVADEQKDEKTAAKSDPHSCGCNK